MKKFLALMLAGFMAMAFASCSNEADAKIDRYESIRKEFVDACKSGDFDKAEKLADEGAEIEDELNEMKLTPSQVDRLEEIDAKYNINDALMEIYDNIQIVEGDADEDAAGEE